MSFDTENTSSINLPAFNQAAGFSQLNNVNNISNPTSSPSQNYFTTTCLNNQQYNIEVWIYNQIDGFDPVLVPVYFIEELIIDETLKDWEVSGSITIKNDFEILEKGAPSVNGSPQTKANFLFRSDARNKIAIRIKPVVDNDSAYPDEYWQLSFDCIITDYEDLPTNNPQSKLKKINFIDERYVILSEKNIEWSTALYNQNGVIYSSGTKIKTLTDSDKFMSCSDAVKSVISTAATMNSSPAGISTADATMSGDSFIEPSSVIRVGSSKGPSGLANPDYPLNNFSNLWDKGSPDSQIIYTSPANNRVWDDIDYISSTMKASDGGPLFLRLDRYDRVGGKQFSLLPLSYYLNNAANHQIERLLFSEGIDTKNSQPYCPRAPYDLNQTSNVLNFQSGVASRIGSYELLPMESDDDYDFNNNPIHTYDFTKGQFTIEFKGNCVKDFYNDIQQYMGGLYGYNKSKQLLLHINQTKQKGLMINNLFIPRTTYPKKLAGVSMMKKFLFLNQAIAFQTQGLTIRTPGKFVFLDRETSTLEKNPFDDKVLGQWIITRVRHIFSKNAYTNNIIATKMDAFNKWWDVLDTTAANY